MRAGDFLLVTWRFLLAPVAFRPRRAADAKRGGAAKKHSLAPSGEGYAERKCKGGERKLTDAHRGWGKRCTFPITWRGDGVGNGESGCAGDADRQPWGLRRRERLRTGELAAW